jgi:brefeldin A-inhibited guanine nucleotide-exchange protein
MKNIQGSEAATDLRSQGVRSKLVSLVLVKSIIKEYPSLFFYPSPALFTDDVRAVKSNDVSFLVAIRQYLCLSITRNISSIVPQIFDLAMDIFGLMLLDLRALMKVVFINLERDIGYFWEYSYSYDQG